jgi:thiosulfate/3-mercaptopyruvate sulfurtransferase
MAQRALASVAAALRVVSRRRARVVDISAASELIRGGLPNAVQCPLTDLKGAGGGPILPADFAQLAAHLGIQSATPVVVCADSVVLAARFWYISQLYGKTGVSLLDGTANELLDAYGDAEGRCAGDDVASEDTPFAPFVAQKLLANADDVQDASADGSDAKIQIIDARTRGEFVAGHIPSSLNLPYASLLTRDGKFKDGESLRASIEAAGVDTDKQSIVYCGVGLRASAVVLGLHLAAPHAPLAANYDGSMSDWLRRGHAITRK